MAYTTDDLRAAAQAGIIAPAQLEPLFAFLDARAPVADIAVVAAGPRFDVVHLLWYAGALIVMGAMGLFSTLAFSMMGGGALVATAVIYAAAFTIAGHHLWTVRGLRTPGGLLIAVAVSMAPLAVFGLQTAFGLWGQFGNPGEISGFYVWIKGSWIFMELAAIAATALALRFYRFPFIVMIAAIALWFMSMDIVPWITGSRFGDFETSRQVSIGFGLAMILAAVVVNARQRTGDFAYWLYLFGVVTFWGGISATSGGSDLSKAMYCVMNVSFVLIAIFLSRRVFALFGTIGIAMYLGDLAGKVFQDSLMFPFALSMIGVGIIALGLYYHRHQAAIEAWFDTRLPAALRRLRPVTLQMSGT